MSFLVACFDVFDTTLTRQTASPEAVFLLLGRRLARGQLIPASPEVFARQRIAAEATARRNAAHGEPCGPSIYRNLSHSLELPGGDEIALWQAEQDYEKGLIRPVPSTVLRIQSARRQGRQIVFLSDMYMDAAFLESLLKEHGVFEDGDLIFVSCEHAASKRDGSLFTKVSKTLGVPPHKLEHYGNDVLSDVARPRRMGLSANHCTACDLTQYEALAETAAYTTAGASSLLGGASRLARLSLSASGSYEPELHDPVTGVAGPLLVAYLAWVLRQSQLAGLDTLYFVSRDGQIMLEVAGRLAERLNIRCSLRYLYGSRQAWHAAGLTHVTNEDLSWILEQHGQLTGEMVVRRLHLGKAETLPILAGLGIDVHRLNDPLSAEQRSSLAAALTGNTALAKLVVATAESQRYLLKSYLAQEGVLEQSRWGLVDIGWRGRLQGSLERSLGHFGTPLPVGFYIGLNDVAGGFRGRDMRAYLFDMPQTGGWGRAPAGLPMLSEMFCQATHGMVLGYEATDSGISPRLNEGPTAARLSWGVPLVHEGILACVDQLSDAFFEILPTIDLRPLVCDLVEAFWARPSRAEALRWGSFPYEDDQAGLVQAPLATPYSIRDVYRFLSTGNVSSIGPTWPAASHLMTNSAVAAAFRCATAIRRTGGAVRRRLSVTFPSPKPFRATFRHSEETDTPGCE